MDDRVKKSEVLAAARALAATSAREQALAQMNRPSGYSEALEADAQYRVASDLRRRAQAAYDKLFHRWDGQDDPTPPTAA